MSLDRACFNRGRTKEYNGVRDLTDKKFLYAMHQIANLKSSSTRNSNRSDLVRKGGNY